MRRILLFTLGLFCCLSTLQAAKTKTIKAEYTYYAPENVTLEQAKQTALQRARLQGLADEFGTNMNQIGTTIRENVNGESSASVFQLTNSTVKGEWIRDIDEPKYEIKYVGSSLIVSVKVKFEAREMKSVTVDYEAKVLRNGTDDKFEADEFKNGDDLFLSFKTPKAGYLAVYLVEGDVAYCLLPYRNQTDGICQVKANRRYVFFSTTEDKDANVDEYVMTTDKQIESDIVYIIFSPNEFSKAADTQSDRQAKLEGTAGLPRELSFEKFQNWLSRLMGQDEKMGIKSIPILIKK
ncbi:MAG: DUF4384 domain-containing protein [Prevotella sp.]|nr:DUF4384 domain-containing protein [Prevotella sp.]